MQKRTHRLPILLNILGEEHEIEMDVQYTVTPGRSATPPRYSHGGLPPEPAEISVIGGRVDTEFGECDAPLWLLDYIQNSDAAYQALGDAAEWGVTYRDPDAERDRRIDDELAGAGR